MRAFPVKQHFAHQAFNLRGERRLDLARGEAAFEIAGDDVASYAEASLDFSACLFEVRLRTVEPAAQLCS